MKIQKKFTETGMGNLFTCRGGFISAAANQQYRKFQFPHSCISGAVAGQ